MLTSPVLFQGQLKGHCMSIRREKSHKIRAILSAIQREMSRGSSQVFRCGGKKDVDRALLCTCYSRVQYALSLFLQKGPGRGVHSGRLDARLQHWFFPDLDRCMFKELGKVITSYFNHRAVLVQQWLKLHTHIENNFQIFVIVISLMPETASEP